MAIIKNSRGQAALTDSIYFLIIATTLSAFLFSFSVSYGQGLEESVQQKEIQEFTASALKTIIYTTIPRDPHQSILDPVTDETDFLLAGIKEDYFDDQSMGDIAPLLRQNVHLAMLPLEPANDYLFYFYIPLDTSGPSTNPNSQNKFPYFLFWKSEYEIDPSNPNSRFVTINPKGHTAYYCHPAGDRIEIVDNLLFTLTRKSKTTGRSRLPFEQGYRNLESTLVVWPSQSFPDKITDGAADVFAPLNCCKADDWDAHIKNPDTVPIPATCTANHIFEATAPAP